MRRLIALALMSIAAAACGGGVAAAPTTTAIAPEPTTTTTLTLPSTTGPATTTTTGPATTTTGRPPTTTTTIPAGVQSVDACRLPGVASGVGIGFPHPADRMSSLGTVRAVVLFVDFPDQAADVAPDDVLAIMSPEGEQMLSAMSYGRFDLVLEPYLEWLTLEMSSSTFGEAVRTHIGHRDVIQAAVTAADHAVDFSGIDLVLVMATPNAAAVPYGPTWLGYTDEVSDTASAVYADGNRMLNAITSGADLTHWGHGWLVHEVGHSLTLVDLYPYEGSFEWARPFSVMDLISGEAPELFAYERWVLEWLDDDQIVCLDGISAHTATISPVEVAGGVKAVMVPDASRAVIVESRRAVGYDERLSREGAVVYVVDAAIPSGAGTIQVANGRSALVPGESVTVDGVTATVLDSSPDGDTVQITFGG